MPSFNLLPNNFTYCSPFLYQENYIFFCIFFHLIFLSYNSPSIFFLYLAEEASFFDSSLSFSIFVNSSNSSFLVLL